MGFFLGIYNPDTINAALGHDDRRTPDKVAKATVASNVASKAASNVVSNDGVNLRQNWNDLAENFTWKKHPAGTGKIPG